MNVKYCDLCMNPIKSPRFILGAAEFDEDPYDPENIKNGIKPIHYHERDICLSCHCAILDIFEKKADFFLKQAEEFRKLYARPTKTPAHELKKKKKEK